MSKEKKRYQQKSAKVQNPIPTPLSKGGKRKTEVMTIGKALTTDLQFQVQKVPILPTILKSNLVVW
jgi:hypothetical protein